MIHHLPLPVLAFISHSSLNVTFEAFSYDYGYHLQLLFPFQLAQVQIYCSCLHLTQDFPLLGHMGAHLSHY